MQRIRISACPYSGRINQSRDRRWTKCLTEDPKSRLASFPKPRATRKVFPSLEVQVPRCIKLSVSGFMLERRHGYLIVLHLLIDWNQVTAQRAQRSWNDYFTTVNGDNLAAKEFEMCASRSTMVMSSSQMCYTYQDWIISSCRFLN